MTIKGKAYIAGAYRASDPACAGQDGGATARRGGARALKDAGLSRDDVDGYFCAGDAPGPGPATMAEYMNLKLRHVDSPSLAERPMWRWRRTPPKPSRSANATSR